MTEPKQGNKYGRAEIIAAGFIVALAGANIAVWLARNLGQMLGAF